MKKNIFKLMSALLFFGIPFLSSCAPTLGPAFQKVGMIPENVGLVYIYRPPDFFGAGISYDVKANGVNATTLYNGGYYPYFAKQGDVEFSAKTESTSAAKIYVEVGQTYYLKGTIGWGVLVGRPHLEVVSPEVGQVEIAKCKLIPEKK